MVAGVTVTAYLVPQVMAYSELAGLPPAAGLWAAVAALGVYAIVGTSPQLSVGPESTTALMTGAALGTLAVDGVDPAALAAALALAVAAVCFVAWACRLGVPGRPAVRPVMVGYLAGVAVLMIGSSWAGSPVPRSTPTGSSPSSPGWPTIRGPSTRRPWCWG